jgi:heterodisulfide reductase subunit B
LISAQYELAANPKMRQKIELILEEQYSNGMEIINAVQLFYKYGLEKIKEKVVKKLDNMKIACYYGCLLTRPNEITKFDDAEHPTSMEKLVEITGAKTIEWNFKVECCGASHSIARTEIVESLSKKILDDALKHGANAIVVACPMCHSNLDMRQLTMKKHNDDHQEVPVYYLSELLGLALGIEPKALGIDLHFIDAMKF